MMAARDLQARVGGGPLASKKHEEIMIMAARHLQARIGGGVLAMASQHRLQQPRLLQEHLQMQR